MARIRTIKPEFPHSESMGRVSRESRLCFIMLWTIADDSGRLRGNSRMLASLLFPYDDDAKNKIEGWLDQLSSEGCIARYEVDGTSYLEILHWGVHQKIDKPTVSKLPPFNANSRTLASSRESSTMDMDRDRDQEGNWNGEEDSADLLAKSPPPPPEPAAITLPLVDKSEYGVTNAMVSEWSTAYPAVDVLQKLREMRAWCIANPNNRKTARGVQAFIVRWLGKEQDKGRPRQVATESFAERDERLAAERYREATGQTPQPVKPMGEVIDITPKRISK